jgi:environmental stress-induced protein Ves
MKILRRADYRATRWKNGRGVSHQIAAYPATAGHDGIDWQVSRPEIAQDGPFSHFPGLDRQLTLVDGAGLVLRLRGAADGVDLERRIDAPLEPFAFRGEWDVECRLLDGPVQVFNVMTRRGRAGARIEIVAAGAASPLAKPAGETLLVYVARGPIEAWGRWGKATLAADDSILVDDRGATEIAAASAGDALARLALVRLHEAAGS